jgi:hypothetical protein
MMNNKSYHLISSIHQVFGWTSGSLNLMNELGSETIELS